MIHKAGTLEQMSQARVQPRPCSSMSKRMSSGTASVGCVSFSWNTTLVPKSSKLLCVSLNRLTTSCYQEQPQEWVWGGVFRYYMLLSETRTGAENKHVWHVWHRGDY